MSFLDDIGEIHSLYGFKSTTRFKVVTDEEGNVVKDGSGQPEVRMMSFEAESRHEEAFERIEGTDIDEAIAEVEVEVRRRHSKVMDHLLWLAGSARLAEMLQDLYWQSTERILTEIAFDDVEAMREAWREAIDKRRELRERLEWYYVLPRPLARRVNELYWAKEKVKEWIRDRLPDVRCPHELYHSLC